MNEQINAVKDLFSYNSIKEEQLLVIQSVIQKKDFIAVHAEAAPKQQDDV